MNTVVVIPVYNRPVEVLERTLDALSLNPPEFSTVVVDDASTVDYQALYGKYRNNHWAVLRLDTLAARPDTYSVDGWNLEVYALNQGIELATSLGGETLILLSSDVVVPPFAIDTAVRHVAKHQSIFVGSVQDRDTERWYCHPDHRHYPMHWFMAAPLAHVNEIGGFDEDFLGGIGWGDNDFMGRLLLRSGELLLSYAVVCEHQSHPATSYSDHKKGYRLNERRIREKWGHNFAPFEDNGGALAYTETRDESGLWLRKPRTRAKFWQEAS